MVIEATTPKAVVLTGNQAVMNPSSTTAETHEWTFNPGDHVKQHSTSYVILHCVRDVSNGRRLYIVHGLQGDETMDAIAFEETAKRIPEED